MKYFILNMFNRLRQLLFGACLLALTIGNSELSKPLSLNDCPLKGLTAIAILPQYVFMSARLKSKLNEIFIRELEKIGTVVTLECPDVTGFGRSQGMLSLFVENISLSNEEILPMMRVSLFLNAAAVIKRTEHQCRVPIWSTQIFTEGNVDETNSKNILTSIQKIVEQFVDEYRAANRENKKKPTFYVYI
jgi:hypothetical protein